MSLKRRPVSVMDIAPDKIALDKINIMMYNNDMRNTEKVKGENMKTKTQATPGPWKFQQQDIYVEGAKLTGKTLAEHEGYFRDNDGGWFVSGICKVLFKGEAKRERHTSPDPEGQANARLIAAAPDLLEVCKLMMVVAHSKGQTILAERIKAAIAKAEGNK